MSSSPAFLSKRARASKGSDKVANKVLCGKATIARVIVEGGQAVLGAVKPLDDVLAKMFLASKWFLQRIVPDNAQAPTGSMRSAGVLHSAGASDRVGTGVLKQVRTEARNLGLHEIVRGCRTWIAGIVRILFVCGLVVFLSTPVTAQEPEKVEAPGVSSGQEVKPPPPQSVDQPQQPAAPDQPQPKKKKKFTIPDGIVVAPLPISSPAIGTGLTPILGYIFPFSKNDKVSPPSVIGVAGLITNNGSGGFAVGGQLFFKENTYEITSGFVHGDVNYNIYGDKIATGLKLPLNQTGEAFFGEFLRRLAWKFFAGPRFMSGNSIITVRPNDVPTFPIPADVGLHTTLRSIGAKLTRDTRPNHFYPVSGTFFTFTSDFFSQDLGSKYSFQSYRSQFNKYWSLSEKQVLAYDANFCATGGSPPFYGNCIYGTNNELRGYTAGQYFTRYSLATQMEYRLVLPKRFGLVIFGGLGGVIPSGSQFLQQEQNSHFLPSGGGGLRFELSKKYHVNLRADIAQGVNGHTFGMGVGEAF
jgi:Omp85 superfamily domain